MNTDAHSKPPKKKKKTKAERRQEKKDKKNATKGRNLTARLMRAEQKNQTKRPVGVSDVGSDAKTMVSSHPSQHVSSHPSRNESVSPCCAVCLSTQTQTSWSKWHVDCAHVRSIDCHALCFATESSLLPLSDGLGTCWNAPFAVTYLRLTRACAEECPSLQFSQGEQLVCVAAACAVAAGGTCSLRLARLLSKRALCQG